MKIFVLILILAFVELSANAEPDDTTLEALKDQVDQLTNQVRELQLKVSSLESRPGSAAPAARAGSSYMNIGFDTIMFGGWSTAENPSERLELGDHDPQQRGFSLRNAELAIDGAVDPYFKGFGNIVLTLDEENETSVELEEAFMLSTSLPANLQLKAGQFFAEFGRQNTQHPHSWAFVDQPLILNRVFGPDGLRNVGVRASWLVPTPFFTEVMLGIFNGEGDTAYSFRNPEADFYGRTPVENGLDNVGDLLYVPRITSSFDLSDQQTLVLGASAAFGPNDAGEDTRTQIYGFDAYWKWKPANADAGFPFVSWQTEVLARRLEAAAGETDDEPPVAVPAETLKDWGFYSQVLWGFVPRWVAGLRGEQVWANSADFEEDDTVRGDRTRISPNITFLPSEFSKLRLQYNFDDLQDGGVENSVWLQAEFALGAHAAHKF